MKKFAVALSLCLVALPAFSAIKYEFHQTKRTDDSAVDFSGRAVIDGSRSRVDFIGGNAYKPGSYIIMNGTQMTIVDPTRKVYDDVNTQGVAATLGAMNITIANKSVKSETLDDHPVIAGYPTDHYRVTFTYDITLQNGAIAITQKVESVTDKWMTSAFGDISAQFLTGGSVHTGNAELDSLLTEETQKEKGFPLREVTTTSTTATKLNPNSELKINPTRKSTSEMVVTSIAKADVHASTFNIPADFRKADAPKDDSARTHTVNMEPSSNN